MKEDQLIKITKKVWLWTALLAGIAFALILFVFLFFVIVGMFTGFMGV